MSAALSRASHRRLSLAFEQRGRYEERFGNAFGKDPDISTGLFRTRLGLTWSPVGWLKLSGMLQDSRSPWYGPNAPSTVRDSADLHEAYVEFFPAQQGFGGTSGRMMLNYGEGRLIGTPQWGNLSRTFDHARLYWRSPHARLELLVVSAVRIRIDQFNRPALADRVWGTYNSFPDFYRKNLLDVYLLRHDQETAGVNTAGFRLAGPLFPTSRYSVEGAIQNGKMGNTKLMAYAWFTSINHHWKLSSQSIDLLGEYKYASGTSDPSGPGRNSTFDQLYAANHDKFGHQDLFGWRNIHNFRSLATWGITEKFSVHFMYNNFWLASASDALYSGAGRAIVRSTDGTAGRHVGQEADLFTTVKYRHFTFGAGYGHFFSGEFIRRATTGVGPSYIYIFHTYSL